MSITTRRIALALTAVITLGTAGAFALARQSRTDTPPAGERPPAAAQQQMPDLIGGLEDIEGCLGVEAARTMSGKNVIFAWFQDKKAALKWYYSDMHTQLMDDYFHKVADHHPLDGIPDDIGPLMVIASITMSDTSQHEESSLPVSQIAVEVYAPVNGGLHLGGRFAPDALEVPDMKDLTPN